jgi:hypothetical protein
MSPDPAIYLYPVQPNPLVIIPFRIKPAFLAMINPPIFGLIICPEPI